MLPVSSRTIFAPPGLIDVNPKNASAISDDNDLKNLDVNESIKDSDSFPDESDIDDDGDYLPPVIYRADVERLAITAILGLTEEEMGLALNADEETRDNFVANIRDVLVADGGGEEVTLAKQQVIQFIFSQPVAFKSEIFGAATWSFKLVGLDLRGVDFSGFEFLGADFSNSDLCGANFSGTELTDAIFNGSNLSGALFNESVLCRGEFVGANLSGANFGGADLFAAEMRNANLQGAKLNVKSMSGAKFEGADLRGADFAGGNLQQAEFSGANLENACFKGIQLTNVNFIGANLRNADFSGVDLMYLNFSKANLIGAKFIGDSMRSANFSGADLRDVSFVGQNFFATDFSRANLSGANFSGMNLSGLRLDGAILSDVDFSDANVENMIFGRANLNRANFNGANVKSARFSLDSNVDKSLFELYERIDNSFRLSNVRVLPQKSGAQANQRFTTGKPTLQGSPEKSHAAAAVIAASAPKIAYVPMPQKIHGTSTLQSQKMPLTPTTFWSWISGITFRLSSFFRSVPGRIWGPR